jgi:hypothetical protein
MSVEDELHWARGHLERLRSQMDAGASLPETREHFLGFMNHMALAVDGLVAEVAAIKGPRRREVPDGAAEEAPDV